MKKIIFICLLLSCEAVFAVNGSSIVNTSSKFGLLNRFTTDGKQIVLYVLYVISVLGVFGVAVQAWHNSENMLNIIVRLIVSLAIVSLTLYVTTKKWGLCI